VVELLLLTAAFVLRDPWGLSITEHQVH